MSRVVLLIDHPENRRLLAEWLSLRHEVVVDPRHVLDGELDLGIVDRPSLERYARDIEALKRAVRPLFVPFLLVTARPSGGLRSVDAWKVVDELIASPVEKLELSARVEILLRARALSLENASLALRLERELARARQVQTELLPKAPPSLPGFDLAARCIPAAEVGGDFFDWEELDASAVLTVGDVMGKGIPAALLAATVRSVLRALARQNPPAAALELLRQTLSGDLERTSSFVTLFHARAAGGEVRYVDAGHGHAHVRRATGKVERLERGGRPIGFPSAVPYRESSLTLARGDVLLVCSDGLVSCGRRGAGELIAGLDAEAPAARLVDQLLEGTSRSESLDDVTILVLKATAG